MRRVLRPGMMFALALLLMPLSGCEGERVWIDLPGFSADAIQGIWLWRLSATGGSYERVCRIPFGGLTTSNGTTTLSYTQECLAGLKTSELQATVVYPAADTIRIELFYVRTEGPGTYKITSYGSQGESALSATTLQL